MQPRSVYAGDLGGQDKAEYEDEEEEEEEQSMLLPDIIADGAKDLTSLTTRRALAEDSVSDDGDDQSAQIGMPPLKDMMIPVTRRESIHLEKFFTSEYVRTCQMIAFV
jgi:hypothetical protein